MNKLRVFYIVSLIMLVLLLIFSIYFIFKPITSEDSILLTSKHEFVEIGRNATVSFNIYNHEDVVQNYTIVVFLNDKKLGNFTAIIKRNSDLKYIGRFPINENVKGNVTVLIYKEGELDPIDQIIFPLRFKNSIA